MASGGFPNAGSDTIEPRVVTLEEQMLDTQIHVATLSQNVKHNENLMDKVDEKYDKIIGLLSHLCQIQAANSGSMCPT